MVGGRAGSSTEKGHHEGASENREVGARLAADKRLATMGDRESELCAGCETENGLGLKDIKPHFFGYVIIGRRSDYPDAFNAIRSRVFRDEQIDIRSWDGIIERARTRAAMFSAHRAAILQPLSGLAKVDEPRSP